MAADFENSIHYDEWQNKRIEKLISILGENWFKGKKILEVGCGFGHIGKKLMDRFDCIVDFTEGRNEYISKIKENCKEECNVWCVDHDSDYSEVLAGKYYDLIIHWGLLYHLSNWKQDLEIIFKHSDIVSLELEVLDFDDPTRSLKINEFVAKIEPFHFDQALNGIGTRITQDAIEIFLKNKNLKFKRYDDSDLNNNHHVYDWIPKNDKSYTDGKRRFWMIYKDGEFEIER